MLRRRRFLVTLLAVLLPLSVARAQMAGRAASVHLVNGWIVTDRDLAALARLDR